MKDVITENYQLMFGDCLERMKEIPSDSVDLIVTSPPYNNHRNRRTQKNRENFWNKTNIVYDVCEDNMDDDAYQDWQIKCLNEMLRILKPTGTIAYQHKEQIYNFKTTSPLEWILKTDCIYRQRIIWDRMCMQAYNPVRYYRFDEDIYLLGKTQKGFKWNKEFAKYNNIWRIKPSDNNMGHPATFPIEIPKRLIESFTQEGDIVLDCFNGVGNTGVAAVSIGRKYIGIEISEKYLETTEKRLRNCL